LPFFEKYFSGVGRGASLLLLLLYWRGQLTLELNMSNQATRTLAILVDADNKVVKVLSRALQPINPAPIGGHYEFHYDPATYVDPREALMREVREESGFRLGE
jgi:hypothetical protein